MTSNQIETILDEIGSYDFDIKIPLNEIHYIYITTDGCLYPSANTRFEFHKIGDGGIMIVHNGYSGDNNEFVSVTKHYIDFSVIAGFKVV